MMHARIGGATGVVCAWPPDTRYYARYVEDLHHMRQEAVVWKQPQPLHGRYQAPVRCQPAARSNCEGRPRTARIRVHPLPEERQGRQGLVPPVGLAPDCVSPLSDDRRICPPMWRAFQRTCLENGCFTADLMQESWQRPYSSSLIAGRTTPVAERQVQGPLELLQLLHFVPREWYRRRELEPALRFRT
jgi:hypothetical protein